MRDFKVIAYERIKKKDSAINTLKETVIQIELIKTQLSEELEQVKEKYQRADLRVKRAFGEITALKKRIEKMKTTSF
jgi:peptidoglycan hydrolase CwlO-like protein